MTVLQFQYDLPHRDGSGKKYHLPIHYTSIAYRRGIGRNRKQKGRPKKICLERENDCLKTVLYASICLTLRGVLILETEIWGT